MKGRFEAMLARYGQRVAVSRRETGETAEGRAFVQPILEQRKEPPVAVTPLGAVSEERWLYLGSADVALAPGDRVACGGRRFTAQEVRDVWWQDQTAYRWGLLRPEKEAAG